jgi:voltage-gated potassium channel
MAVADDTKRERWERATGWPAIVASFAFLIAYSWSVLDEHQTPVVQGALIVVLLLVWAFFLVDFVVRLVLSVQKLAFIRRNPIDLLSVFVPMIRPFRLLTALRRIPALGGGSASHLRRRVLVMAGASVVLFLYVISLTEFRVERDAHGATIVSFGDAVWWACVTMSTVGYGDFYPVTILGRLLAVVLMIGGIAIVGIASATIVSYLTERTRVLRIAQESERDREDGDPPHDGGGDGD